MKRHVGVVAAVAIAVAGLTGCSGKAEEPKAGDTGTSQTGTSQTKAGEPTTMTIEISYDDLLKQQQISRSVRLSVGDFLQLSLGSNASTGYQWADKMLLSDPKVMAQTGHETIAPTDGQPGAAGREVWMLQATAPGTTTASTTYGQPWPGGEKESWVFSVNVEVD